MSVNKENSHKTLNRRFCVAPMLDWTDRHCRYFLRLISKNAVLYTEMVTTHAILHGDRHRHLKYNHAEHPVALQLGGSNPAHLAECAKIAEDYAYDEINLNVGCPSDRVQEGKFGACLMAEPELVAECIAAMTSAVKTPVTVKTRIGIDDNDSYEALTHFIGTVAAVGCRTFIIHARKAWLKGLSPKENREIPPLKYDVAYQIKKDFPALDIIVNGGITQWSAIHHHLQHVDGVMVGREAYHNPYFMAPVDAELYGATVAAPTRHAVMQQFIAYAEQQLENGEGLQHLSRHILGLFHGVVGARRFRRYISEHAHRKGADVNVLQTALALMRDDPV